MIKDVKKTLTVEQFEAVVIDVKKYLNNPPLTYLDSNRGEERVLTPNSLMWGKMPTLLREEKMKKKQVQ